MFKFTGKQILNKNNMTILVLTELFLDFAAYAL